MNKVWQKVMLIVLITLMIIYNIHQINKYKNCVIHWDSMTKESFWKNFFKESFQTKEEAAENEKLLSSPVDDRKK